MKLIRYTTRSLLLKIFNSKLLAALLILGMVAWDYSKLYVEYVKAVGQPITWCLFPFFLTSSRLLVIFYLSVIYLNTDVPFMQHINMYQVIRTGRTRWALGQAGGIFLRSLLLTGLFALITVLPFTGHLLGKNEWGKVEQTIAAGKASISTQEAEFGFYREIMEKYSPVQLMALTILICALICTFLGLIMFLISFFADRIFAVAAASALSFLLFVVENGQRSEKQKIASLIPAYWGKFASGATQSGGYYHMPSLTYMLLFFAVTLSVLTALICLRVKKVEFKWEEEDL